MEKKTAKEILEIVEKYYTVSSFADCEFLELETPVEFNEEQLAEIERIGNKVTGYYELKKKYILQNIGLGEVEEVESVGGGEGDGSVVYSVKHFKEHDVYIKTEGYYQSYAGTEWENGYGYEVKPKEVVVTQYFSV